MTPKQKIKKKSLQTEKKNEVIEGRVIKDIMNLFEHEEEEDYYKSVRIGNFWNNYCIEYESDGDRNKTLSIEEYFNKIRPYLQNIINDLEKFDACKIQLTIAIYFINQFYFFLRHW